MISKIFDISKCEIFDILKCEIFDILKYEIFDISKYEIFDILMYGIFGILEIFDISKYEIFKIFWKSWDIFQKKQKVFDTFCAKIFRRYCFFCFNRQISMRSLQKHTFLPLPHFLGDPKDRQTFLSFSPIFSPLFVENSVDFGGPIYFVLLTHRKSTLNW